MIVVVVIVVSVVVVVVDFYATLNSQNLATNEIYESHQRKLSTSNMRLKRVILKQCWIALPKYWPEVLLTLWMKSLYKCEHPNESY